MNGDLFKKGFWIYYSAPFLGGAGAGIMYDHLFLKSKEEIGEVDEYKKDPNVVDRNGRRFYRTDIELSVTKKEDNGDEDSYEMRG